MSPNTIWEVWLFAPEAASRAELGGYVQADCNLDSEQMRAKAQGIFEDREVLYVYNTGQRLLLERPLA